MAGRPYKNSGHQFDKLSVITAIERRLGRTPKHLLCLGVSVSHRKTNVMYLMGLWRLHMRQLLQICEVSG